MEHSLTLKILIIKSMNTIVLILILMEHSLTYQGTEVNTLNKRLNPYSNGTLSDTIIFTDGQKMKSLS